MKKIYICPTAKLEQFISDIELMAGSPKVTSNPAAPDTPWVPDLNDQIPEDEGEDMND